jgi:hypothetical protein
VIGLHDSLVAKSGLPSDVRADAERAKKIVNGLLPGGPLSIGDRDARAI